MLPVVIVGGGIGGLYAASMLAERGRSVRVLERSNRAGGRMQSITRGMDTYNIGQQVYHDNYTQTLDLLKRLGLSERASYGHGIQGIGDKGSLVRVSRKASLFTHLDSKGRLSAANFVAKYVTFGKPFDLHYFDSAISEYDDRSVSDVFSVEASDTYWRFVLRPLCLGYGLSLPHGVSLQFILHMYRLQQSPAFTLKGGNDLLVQELARQVGQLVEYDTSVLELSFVGDRVVGLVTESGETIEAEAVIVATPLPTARTLLRGCASLFAMLGEFPDGPIASPLLLMDRPMSSDIAAYIAEQKEGDEPTFGMITDQAIGARASVPSGKSALFFWGAYPQTRELASESDEALLEQAIKIAARTIPEFSEDRLEERLVVRHEQGVGRFTPGQYARSLAFRDAAAQIDGLHVISPDLWGTHVESGLRQAKAAVQSILKDR